LLIVLTPPRTDAAIAARDCLCQASGRSVSEGPTVPTILVADDNINIQKMVSTVFKEKGIRVVAVGNGEAACRKVPEVQPDVVLADVFMPVRNGYEVCEFVKQDPQFAETPVILLVGAFDPLDEKEAQRVGANGVLKKPFVPPEPLIAMVSSLLKLEPPPVEAPPPAVEVAPPPPPPPVAAAPAPEFASPSNDYDEADVPVETYGDPVATPAAKSRDDEPEEDDAEPASEWARRRASMDYEIGVGDNADMVEKLASEGAAEEPEILASTKRVPFGGANVPDPSEASAESAASKWSDYAQDVAEEATQERAETPAAETPAREPEIVAAHEEMVAPAEESAAPVIAESTAADSESSVWQSEPVPVERSARETAASWSAGDTPDERVPHRDDAVREAASATWPLPQIPEPHEEKFSEPQVEAQETLVEASLPESQAAWQETVERASEPPLALPEAKPEVVSEQVESEPAKLAEPPAEEAPSRPSIDQAILDDVVAKVISKLEPQLHQALANGVVRPLVEELLSQRDRK
jgi:CheY-like chemotaxis protein